jgi:hypothetical protein
MKYYAYLKQSGEGCDYTIGCAQTLITIEASNDDEAREKLSEEISENYYDERELSEVQLFKEPIEFDLNKTYDKMKSSKEESNNKMQHLKDREEYERLRKKFGE